MVLRNDLADEGEFRVAVPYCSEVYDDGTRDWFRQCYELDGKRWFLSFSVNGKSVGCVGLRDGVLKVLMPVGAVCVEVVTY